MQTSNDIGWKYCKDELPSVSGLYMVCSEYFTHPVVSSFDTRDKKFNVRGTYAWLPMVVAKVDKPSPIYKYYIVHKLNLGYVLRRECEEACGYPEELYSITAQDGVVWKSSGVGFIALENLFKFVKNGNRPLYEILIGICLNGEFVKQSINL